MNDEFLKYYNRELAYLRHKGQDFGSMYPKIAARLKLSEEQVEDPHVARILEGCAFLTAQIRQSLDNSFPQLTEALIGQLFPDFHAPIPSLSILKIACDETATTGLNIAKGEKVSLGAQGFKSCTFRTCYDTQVLPIEMTSATFENAPFKGVGLGIEKESSSVLKLAIQGYSPEIELNQLCFDNLRLFFNGQPQVCHQLYQLMHQSALGIAIVVHEVGTKQESLAPSAKVTKTLTPRHIIPVGYDQKSAVVPYGKQSFIGSRLLVEYFHFPEKFLFSELTQLDPSWFGHTDKAEIWIYFDRSNEWLEKQVTKDNIMLGCTPIINLFSYPMEPSRVVPTEYEYPLHPEHLEPDTTEVVKIEEVGIRSWKMNYQKLPPFYAGEHTNYLSESDIYWSMRREDKSWAGGFDEPGRDVYISLIDKEHQLAELAEDENWIMSVKAQCCNRNLAKKLPFGGGLPNIDLPDISNNFGSLRCLVAPSETIRPAMDGATRWQFAKLMTLSHFSGNDGLKNLRETLNLYAFKSSPESKALIDSITGLAVTATTGRVNQRGRVGFCHGSDVRLEVSESLLASEQMFLLGNVLSTYFSQFAEINTFTRLSIIYKESGECFYQWPALCGEKALL